ncbi:MAG: S8 family serine peptidase [Lachnospiraceae bacterium]|nr:S8 family serine peptidase [Lachnospiraceae bacterium]
MKRTRWRMGIAAWLLLISLLLDMTGSVWAAPEEAEKNGLFWEEEEIEKAETSIHAEEISEEKAAEEDTYGEEEQVRMLIVIEGESVTEAGYSARGIETNRKAIKLSDKIEEEQQEILDRIEETLDGEPLEVRYQFSLFTNGISAEAAYGELEKIREVEGVEEVFLMPRYQLKDRAETNVINAGEMVGSSQVWDSGYTGAGERIAIIDTGIDLDHPSFDEGAFHYGLELAGEKGEKEISDYNLLQASEIEGVFSQLNAGKMRADLTGQELYQNDKVAFAFNYADRNLNVTHDSDNQGDHGTHVAGIAAANQYVPQADGSYKAQETGVAGIAKNAQVLVMKVFGASGGAYEDDYMAAIEDAVWLGADVINLSLGEAYAGESSEWVPAKQYINEIFDQLAESDTVVTISAGNEGGWSDHSTYGANRTSDVNMSMLAEPGSYTNGFTVASAQNNGFTGYCIQVEGRQIFYQEAENAQISTVKSLDTNGTGTDYEYVFLDSFGEPEDYMGQDVTGKIVLVNRGVISFVEKHQNAEEAGAAGLLVYNNEPGLLNMDLSGSGAQIPCAFLTQTDAQYVREQGMNGTIKIFSQVFSVHSAADGYTMSDFSSWGVPGDLALKPEITAPGGNIYSTLDGGQYGNMSGTSMAAPCVAGLSALVNEYIKEKGLAEKSGLGVRALTQSLLMSTAKPLKNEEGSEYSPRKQGSGLANVTAAVSTPVYILLGEKKGNDGKVKAELGDDPSRKGKYRFDFTLSNMSEKSQYYTLDSSILTEQVIEGQWFNGSPYKLQPQVTFTSSDQEKIYDLNGDKKVDVQDAQELLSHLNQSVYLEKVEYYQDKFDFNGDGVVNTADVHIFLKELEEGTLAIDWKETCIKVEEEAQVSVEVTLSEADREYLDTYFKNGMYIDGFIYLEGKVPLSFPVLAFYGGWTESSMFEPFDYLSYVNGGNSLPAYSGAERVNCLSYRFAGDKKAYYYDSNMYSDQKDESYLPDRNAVSSQSGDQFAAVHYGLIRNAELAKVSIVDAETGKIYFEKEEKNLVAAYYEESSDTWRNRVRETTLGWAGTDSEGKPLPEGTQVDITVTAIPSYYHGKPENAGAGAVWKVPVTIDNTAPKVVDMTESEAGKIQVTVKDNRYTAAVNIYERDKETQISSYAVNQKKPGTEETLEITCPEKVFYLKVIDYAGNETAYRVNRSGLPDTEITDGVTLSQTSLHLTLGEEERLIAAVGPESILDDTVVWSSADENVAAVDETGVVKAVGAGVTKITASTNAKNAQGVSETAECEVSVSQFSVALNGILWDSAGKVRWGSFQSNQPENITWLSDFQSNPYMSAAVTGDKVLAATYTEDGNQQSELYLTDPGNGYQPQKIGTTYWCTDMAYSPASDLVFATYGNYVHWFDSSSGEKKGAVSFASVLGSDNSLVGIAYGGYGESSQYGPMEMFYAIAQSGDLYQLGYSINDGKLRYSHLGKAGADSGDKWYFNSLYYDGESGMLFWASYRGENYVTLYGLEEIYDENGKTIGIQTSELGRFPEGMWPAAGLHKALTPSGKTYQTEEHMIKNMQKSQELEVLQNPELEKMK